MFNVDFLNELRAREIERIVAFFPPGARVLEIGAGTGKQAQEMQRRGFIMTAVEIPSSNYAADRVFPIVDFDGRTLPFPDASFDVVFSSNVLEHVPDLTRMHAEIRRVLRPGGRAVHVLPTHAWRLWTTLSAFPAGLQYSAGALRHPPHFRSRFGVPNPRTVLGYALRVARPLGGAILQRRHGERGNIITEMWYFRPAWWRRNFRSNGFTIVRDEPMGLFYTGNMVMAQRWSWERRGRLARSLGSACRIFQLEVRG